MVASAVFLWILSSAAPSQPLAGQTVKAVVIQGAKRTRDFVIRNEIDTQAGDPYDAKRWAADVQRVRDRGLFWTTDATATTAPDGVTLYLTVEDKWTLIPEFSFDRTAEATEFLVGLYEANLLGTGNELGFRFSRRRGGNTYSAVTENDRVGRTPYSYALEAREGHSYHTVFDQQAGASETTAGYYQYRFTSVYAELGRRLDRDGEQTIGLFYYTRYDRYALWGDDAERDAVNQQTGFAAPPVRLSHRFGFTAAVGKIHYDDYIYRGSRLGIYLRTSAQVIGQPERFDRLSADWKAFAEPFPRHNAGVRFVVGTSNSEDFADRNTLGGVSEVRGFPDERFYGQHVWYGNAEYRYPAVDNRYLLGQVVGFLDAGRAWSGGSPVDRNLAVSTGGGLRLILKPIFSSSLRFDFAQTLNPYRRQGWTLAVHQFF